MLRSSLQLGWKFADQVLDLLRLVPVTNQDRIPRTHDDKVVHPQQSNRRPVLVEDNVVRGIERSHCTVRRVSMLVVLEIIGHRSPAANVIPIKARLDNKDPVGFLHDRVIK